MARVTVEDCIEVIPNRFELVLAAAQRAREIDLGSLLHIERDNDKNTVVALREIAEHHVIPEALAEGIVRRYRKSAQNEEEAALEAGEAATADDVPEEIDEAALLEALKGALGGDAFEDTDDE